MRDSIARNAISAVYTGTGTRPEVVSDRRPLMGGHATISLVGASSVLLDAVFDLANRCEALWSRFLPASDITRLNWAEGESIEVDPLTVGLIEAMREGVMITRGTFDPTVLPNVLAAGYVASVTTPALVTTIPASAQSPGQLHRVTVDGTQVRMPLGTSLDAGGIGKGLAADVLCKFALAQGAWGIMAEIGGDIVVAGQAPDGVAWLLGVENPFDTTELVSSVRIARGAIVTSSQRKRRFDGGRHHLIDPASGVSALTTIETVTVIAATGARAEALTKPGFMWSLPDYLAWLPDVGAAGLLVDATGHQHTTTNWGRYA